MNPIVSQSKCDRRAFMSLRMPPLHYVFMHGTGRHPPAASARASFPHRSRSAACAPPPRLPVVKNRFRLMYRKNGLLQMGKTWATSERKKGKNTPVRLGRAPRRAAGGRPYTRACIDRRSARDPHERARPRRDDGAPPRPLPAICTRRTVESPAFVTKKRHRGREGIMEKGFCTIK